MIKLSGLSNCLLFSALYINSVVCLLLSVSFFRNSNKVSGYVYNREFIIQPTSNRHSPANLNFESDGQMLFSKVSIFICDYMYFLILKKRSLM